MRILGEFIAEFVGEVVNEVQQEHRPLEYAYKLDAPDSKREICEYLMYLLLVSL